MSSSKDNLHLEDQVLEVGVSTNGESDLIISIAIITRRSILVCFCTMKQVRELTET